ncbi:DUF938 domain-containing protein [Qipengyuania sp. GH1]|uniref:DUF938 domain-containing protein n=1 Tax=Qipengyuania aestuarii TaxID=2867241 RepID=UPI001C8672DE|nr:DUF938 domain-containing protein [Qipengyuania aestuarii]
MKRVSPAVARNSQPIAEVLDKELPKSGLVLEIASGTGEHAVFMAHRFASIRWQPTDPDLEALTSAAAWAKEQGLPNLLEPLQLDARMSNWPVKAADALVCINMIHISPWEATLGLFRGAADTLQDGEPLILYGPFLEEHVETALSNLAFDADLKRRSAEWGIRRLGAVDVVAKATDFERTARYQMPANNLMIVYRKNSNHKNKTPAG